MTKSERRTRRAQRECPHFSECGCEAFRDRLSVLLLSDELELDLDLEEDEEVVEDLDCEDEEEVEEDPELEEDAVWDDDVEGAVDGGGVAGWGRLKRRECLRPSNKVVYASLICSPVQCNPSLPQTMNTYFNKLLLRSFLIILVTVRMPFQSL